MKKWILASVVFLSATSHELFSQTVGIGNTSPNSNALLEIGESPGEQGLLLPRLKQGTITGLAGTYGATEQGMLVYDVDNDIVQTWDGASWNTLGGGADTDWQEIGGNVVNPSNRIGIGINFPEAKVHINGGTQDTALFAIGNGDYSAVFSGANVHIEKNLGIGIINPTNALEVSGNIEFSDALMPNGNAGTAGQFLISDGTGNPPKWITVPQVSFLVRSENQFPIPTAAHGSGDFELPPLINRGGGSVASNGRYEAPVTGTYEISAHVTIEPNIADLDLEAISLVLSNGSGTVAESVTQCSNLSVNACTATISTQVDLTAGEVISLLIKSFNQDRISLSDATRNTTWFEGKLVAY